MRPPQPAPRNPPPQLAPRIPMIIPDIIKAKLQELPDKPGVYLMRDRNRKVIYVGKAKSLRSRVRSYFQKGTLRSADPKIRGLIKSIADFDTMVVHNEAEATLSEGRLIKEYRPRYNTSFKDDKRFLLLRLHPNAPVPRLTLVRIRKNDGARYFGPYASAASARAAKDFAERRYGLRKCQARSPGATDHKHCMAEILRKCTAPCIGKITKDDYAERVDEACAFLRGERREVLEELQSEMEGFAAKMDFERAAVLRDTLYLLRRAIKQRAAGRSTPDQKRDLATAGVAALSEELARHNILATPDTLPKVIECFDISNISGTYAVASMVVSVDGLPRPQRYRQFRIKTIEGANDPAMMAEAVRRRYKRLLEEDKPLPDLIVVDGGITQLRAARIELDALGLTEQPCVGLAKQFEEIVWDVANRELPIRLPNNSPALHVMTRIRDEAHRFALTFHRKIRAKRIRASQLDEIEGVGEKRKQLLLRHFGSVNQIRAASLEDLQAVKGIGKAFALLIWSSLHDEGANPK